MEARLSREVDRLHVSFFSQTLQVLREEAGRFVAERLSFDPIHDRGVPWCRQSINRQVVVPFVFATKGDGHSDFCGSAGGSKSSFRRLSLPVTNQAPDPNEQFAALLTRLRLAREWSVDDLAERSQLDLAEVESILRGKDEVQLDAIILLARAFDVSPGELVDGTAD
jgi:DNA-binding Xre family transcriptional regulator